MEQTNTSSTNTLLLVIILVALVGALVWFFAGNNIPAPQTDRDFQVDVTLPTPTTGGAPTEQGTQSNP